MDLSSFAGGLPGWFDALGRFVTPADAIGYAAAGLTIVTYSMRTMVPLRVVGIAANCLFIAYGYFAAVYPQLLLHAILLPINCIRLRQMLRLIALVKEASEDHLSMEWIRSFTTTRRCDAGEIIFAKGDAADAIYYPVSGRYRLVEIEVEVAPGDVIGEIGLVAPDKRRTQTFACTEGGELLVISYKQVKELYFQNPRFGFFLLTLVTRRLLENYSRIEKRLNGVSPAGAGGESALTRSGPAPETSPAARSSSA